MSTRLFTISDSSRVICGAKTRKGHPCRMKSEAGKRRCKFHGGKSTGPRTPEGKARIAKAQRQRWARHRQCIKS
ncbi:MAG: HGGxSTG domain-containing protein [Paracoccaceae bacterium]